jgi:hypothetical protein
MGVLKDQLQSNVVNPAARVNNGITTIGVVTASDESNNTVSIRYVDKGGRKRNRDNVVVRLYGNGADWFPAVDEAVVVEDTGDTCVVVARHVGNYAMDVRSRRQLRQDAFSDESGCQPAGGSIM